MVRRAIQSRLMHYKRKYNIMFVQSFECVDKP